MVFSQKIDKTFEVLIYDTSSKDATQKIIKKYAKKHDNLRWKEITKAEYGHGKTRAVAAFDARGEIVVYLSQDATPQNQRWLYEMVKPFELNEKVMGVLGKQVPWSTAPPVLKYEIRNVFGGFGNDCGTTFFYDDDFAKGQYEQDVISFYSDVNSAARKSILTGEIPYRDVPYAEDQLFGRDIIKAGYIKAYASRGAVTHSNDVSLRDFKARIFDETIGLRKIGLKVDKPSWKLIIKIVVKNSLRDAIRTLLDKEYSFLRKLMWLVLNPFYQLEKWRGVRLGASVDLSDTKIVTKNSLESQQEHKNN